MGARYDVGAHELADSLRRLFARLDRGLDAAHVASHDDRHVAAADLYLLYDLDVGGLAHGVGRLYRAGEAARFYHSE